MYKVNDSCRISPTMIVNEEERREDWTFGQCMSRPRSVSWSAVWREIDEMSARRAVGSPMMYDTLQGSMIVFT